ncbi:MAG: hypothetical protein LBG15_05200 [Dysgonamonadaceae bacterium]|jgi:hypothetical protein|nr:hypothetical protein [Dysgonamonadaceae bacterium]
MLLTTAQYLFVRKSIPFTLFFLRYNAIILIATLLMSFVALFITVAHGEFSTLLLRRFLVMFQMLFTLIYVLPVLIKDEAKAFEEVSCLVCYAFALQGLIHITGYLVPEVGDFLFEMQPVNIQAKVDDPSNNLDRFRLYALCGSIFFELPAAYGVASILFFRLQLKDGQKYITGLKSYIVCFLLIAGITLSGRTGFVGFFIGLFFYFLFRLGQISTILKNSWKIALAAILLVGVFYFILPSNTRNSLTEEVFPFAFEAYYNYVDEGRASTASSDVLRLHYYPLAMRTWLVGEGVVADESRYGFSDAGYMNDLIFGGIPFFICLLIYQCLYFNRPLSIARKNKDPDSRIDYFCFLFLFAYIFVLNYKSTSLGTLHIVEVLYLFAGNSYIMRHNYKEDQEIIS